MQRDRKVNVSFVCQKCMQPLNLDSSFSNLSEHTMAELSLPITRSPDVDVEDSAVDHLVPPFHMDTSTGTNGFTILGSQRIPLDISHYMRVATNLFDTLSSNSDIDHPLCEECSDALIDEMDQQLKLMQEDWDDYKAYLEKLKSESCDENIDSLNRELADLKAEEERLTLELASIKAEEATVLAELEEQKAISEKYDVEEVRYWKEYTKHRNEFIQIEDEQEYLNNEIRYTKGQLEKLKKTNVFNATFHIWHSGHFGTINNFKLGRLPSSPVDWSEINAAWGQTALLLAALANKMNLKFDKYRLIPYGNHSYIEVLGEQKVLPLFGTGGFKFLWDNKFDSAMTAFLECLQQFKEEVEKGTSGFCLPYKMENGKLEDTTTGNSYPIKIQFNSEEQWTKALKFLLTNLKWGLAWVTSEFAQEQEHILV